MRGYTYILASKKGGTLYTGVTGDLPRRVTDHREGRSDFTSRYGVISASLVRGVRLGN